MSDPSPPAGGRVFPAGDISLDELRFDEKGLIPVVVQDLAGGTVRMVAWADRAAVEATLETGAAHFYSRSREQPWRKGETSGNELKVVEVRADCDRDTLLVRAEPAGPSCHTGRRSCFDGAEDRVASELELGWLAEIVARRAEVADAGESYTARLLAEGVDRVAQKVGEEGVETALAAVRAAVETRDEDTATGVQPVLVGEVADLLFHVLVLLRASGASPSEVADELAARHRRRSGK